MSGRTHFAARASDRSSFEISFPGQIQDGCSLPQAGDTITCLTDFATLAGKHVKIPAGAVGQVIDVHASSPAPSQSYVGVLAKFQEISRDYPHGIVIPLDYASDPKVFTYAAPAQNKPQLG